MESTLGGSSGQRRLGAALAGVAGVLLLAGCMNGFGGSNDGESGVDQAARPSMEEILTRYDEMRLKMFARLNAELGTQSWVNTHDEGIGRAGCPESEDPTDESADLPLYSFDGTYPKSDWKRAVEIVQEVGREYGFTDIRSMASQSDNLDVYGEDGYGGSYDFGMSKNTVLTIITGCHRWDNVPAPDDPEPY